VGLVVVERRPAADGLPPVATMEGLLQLRAARRGGSGGGVGVVVVMGIACLSGPTREASCVCVCVFLSFWVGLN
jgi:hypothetical protein